MNTLLLGLKSTFREKLEWLEEAETLALRLQSAKSKTRKVEIRNQENKKRNRKS